MTIRDTGKDFAESLRTIYRAAGAVQATSGDMPIMTLAQQVSRLNAVAARAEAAWQQISSASLTSAQTGRLLEFDLSSVPSDLAARLAAVRSAVDAVTAAFLSGPWAVHGGAERTWNATTKQWDQLMVSKNQRTGFDTALGDLRTALAALAG